MGVNLYENGGLIELGRVIFVEDVPSEYEPHKGVSISYTNTSARSPLSDELRSSEGEISTWDGRFTSEEVRRGDIIRLHMDGPSSGGIVEIFRDDMLVFPQEPVKIAAINQISESNDVFRRNSTRRI